MYELIDICFCFRPKVFPYVNGIHLLGTFELPQGAEKLFFCQSCGGPVCGDIVFVGAGGIVGAVPWPPPPPWGLFMTHKSRRQHFMRTHNHTSGKVGNHTPCTPRKFRE